MFFERLLLFTSITSAAFLLAGLARPWIMLWWEDTQNRRKVIKLYGSIALSTFVMYLVLKAIN